LHYTKQRQQIFTAMKSTTFFGLWLLVLATLSTSANLPAASIQASPSSLPQASDVTRLEPSIFEEEPSKINLTQHKGGKGGGGGGGGGGGKGSGGKSGSKGDDEAGAAAEAGKKSGSLTIFSRLDATLLYAMVLSSFVLKLAPGI